MRRLLLWTVLALATAWLVGFFGFAAAVRAPAREPQPADAVVALTGGSLTRLSTGVRLLSEHKGERLLISGVNRVVTDDELLRDALKVDPELAQCCIDLGRNADNTLGNATETARWAREHDYRRLILVTDDYHMPRSKLELSLAMPEAEIQAYPIRTRWSDPALWRSNLGMATRLLSEYSKFLLISGREMLFGHAREDAKPA